MVDRPKDKSLSKLGLINIIISLIAALATYSSLALVARQFGGSAESDAYFYLVSLTTIFTAVIGSVYSTVFLPVFIDLRIRNDEKEACTFASIVVTWSILGCLLFSFATLFYHDLFFLIVSKYDQIKLKQQRGILIYFSSVFFFSVMSEFFRLLLIAFGRYTVAAMVSILPPVILMVFLFFSDVYTDEGLLALSLLASKASVLLLTVVALKVQGVRLSFLMAKNRAVTNFLKVSAPYGSAGIVTYFATFFFDYMATGLGSGVLTSVTYAQRVFALPVALVVNPLLEIARARFAEFRARNDEAAFQRQYEQLVKILLYFSIPVAVMFFAFAQEIISMLFRRGAFSEENVVIAATCLRLLALSVPLTAMFTLNGRTVESFQRLTWPSFFGTLGNFLLIFLTFNLVQSSGFRGIPYARLLVDGLYFLPFGFLTVHLFGVRFRYGNLIRTLVMATFACVVPVLLYGLIDPAWFLVLGLGHIATAVALMGTFFLVYAALILLFDGELRQIFNTLLAKAK
jgi:putative peptidoglycan lipid II flippase